MICDLVFFEPKHQRHVSMGSICELISQSQLDFVSLEMMSAICFFYVVYSRVVGWQKRREIFETKKKKRKEKVNLSWNLVKTEFE